MNHRFSSLLLSLALTAGLSTTAQAQDWRVSFGKRTHGGELVVDLASRGARIDFRSGRSGQHTSCCSTTAGHYETIEDRVWVPGHTERVWVPARYESYYDSCGRLRQRLVCAGRYEYVEHPGYYQIQSRRVWVPGRTVCSSGGHGSHRGSARRGGRGITVRR